MSFFNEEQTKEITSIAFEAGKIAIDFFHNKNFEVQRKSDNSKVTSADLEVSKFIDKSLSKNFPQIPIVCEEGNLREFEEDIFFLIDPIDGTSSFAKGENEFAINIALVKDQKAIFGLIYSPLFEGGKMVFSNHKNEIISQLNDDFSSAINLTERFQKNQSDQKFKIITSRRSKDKDIENYIEQIHPNFLQNYSVEKLSSAIKFFRIVEGTSDLYLHFRPSMEWDTAAGQALIELMGGKVKNLFFNQYKTVTGEDLKYKKSKFGNQPFIAFIN